MTRSIMEGIANYKWYEGEWKVRPAGRGQRGCCFLHDLQAHGYVTGGTRDSGLITPLHAVTRQQAPHGFRLRFQRCCHVQ